MNRHPGAVVLPNYEKVIQMAGILCKNIFLIFSSLLFELRFCYQLHGWVSDFDWGRFMWDVLFFCGLTNFVRFL